ncbi:MAG: hypothetical protein CMH27_02275 [Micavibrio sp.]|nr:hypothetical protein [Micavibrio sp.]
MRRIGSGDITSFASQPYMMGDSKGKSGYCEWVEAKKSVANQTWSLKKHTQFLSADPAENEHAPHQTKTIMSGICFFDALHYAATEQDYRQKLGCHEIGYDHSDLMIEDLSIEAVCEQTNQPLDLKNLPLPAANGDILVDGTYSLAARKIAKQTAAADLLPAQSQSQYLAAQTKEALLPGQVRELFSAQSGPNPSNLPDTINREKLFEQLDEANKRASKVCGKAIFKMYGKTIEPTFSDYQVLTYNEYINDSGARGDSYREHIRSRTGAGNFQAGTALFVIASLVSSGVTGVIVHQGGGGLGFVVGAVLPSVAAIGFAMNTSFGQEMRRLRSAAKKLPDTMPYKSMLQDFVKAAEGNAHFGRAAQLLENSSSHIKERTLNKGLRQIQKGADILEFSPEQTAQLKSAFESRNFPKQETFVKGVNDLYIALQGEHANTKKAILTHAEVGEEEINRCLAI